MAVFRVDSSESLPEALARLEGSPGVRAVGPNLVRHCSLAPNDELYDLQTYHTPIHSEQAWDITTGSSTVTVAIVDTGLDVEHPEFAGRVIYAENFYDPDTQGADNVFDDSGHGTAVTGIIAARGNNNAGIAGMAWNVHIMTYRACGGPDLRCTIADEVQAIDSAVAHGADVINLSLGGVGTNDLETKAIEDAYDAGVVIVAASGNGEPGLLYEFTGEPVHDRDEMYYPAAFPEVIGVAALDNQSGTITDPAQLIRANFSNYGEDIVSVAAVGTAVETTVPFRPKTEVPYAIYLRRDYSRLTGTSFSCPQVTGAACLVLSRYPEASPLEVRSLIEQNAYRMGGPDVNGNQIDDYMGYGILDVGEALGNVIGGSIYENADFLAGVTASPLFGDDVMIVLKCKRGSDEAPRVSYFIQETGENEEIAMEALPAHANTYLGRFQTTGSGPITFQITGLLGGSPLETLVFVYTFID